MEIVSNFLSFDGNQLDNTINFREIQRKLKDRMNPAPVAATVAAAPGPPDPDKGAPKVYTDPLPEFSGDPVDFEEWERKSGATIK